MADQVVGLSGVTMKHKYAVPFGNQRSLEQDNCPSQSISRKYSRMS